MTDGKTDARAERLKAALRENLKRRKAQARGREAAPPKGAGTTPGEDGGGGEPPAGEPRA